MSDGAYITLSILGMGAITLLTRGFFLLPRREPRLPDWLREGLRYAPLAALVAVVAPEILLTQGAFEPSWRDPRAYAVAVATLVYFWRRDILAVILSGTATMWLLSFLFLH